MLLPELEQLYMFFVFCSRPPKGVLVLNAIKTSHPIELDPLSFHSGRRGGYVAICRKSAFGDMIQEWYTLPQLPQALARCVGETDCWISQGEFASKSRYTKDLLRIQCCFIDLDYYKTEYRDLTPEQISGLIDIQCDEYSIPRPTAVISSGNGVQVKWIFTYPLPAQALPRWKAAQRILLDKFKDLGADPAAADASRILRIVGTKNSKTLPGRDPIVRLIAEGSKWNFETFWDTLMPMTREDVKEARSKALARQQQRRQRQTNKKHPNLVRLAPQALSWDRVNDLRRLADLRRNEQGEVPEGCRELLVFWTLNHLCLSGVVSTQNFEREAMALAYEISPSWAKSFRLCSLETVRRKLEKGLSEYQGRGCTGLYTPRNRTLIKSLSITPEEEVKLKTIVSRAESRERNRLREEKRRRRAGVKPRAKYLANSLTAKEPWKKEGISRATWYRRRRLKSRVNPVNKRLEVSCETSVCVYLYGKAQGGPAALGGSRPAALGGSRPAALGGSRPRRAGP